MNKGNFEDHPGFSASGCPVQMTITAHRYGSSHNGYACSWTGGHCLPKASCKKIVKQYEKESLIFQG
jgi:hypothetical protein